MSTNSTSQISLEEMMGDDEDYDEDGTVQVFCACCMYYVLQANEPHKTPVQRA